MVELKNKAQGFVAESGFLIRAHQSHILAVKGHNASAWSIKSSHKMQEGGLAGTGSAHNGQGFSLLHNQIDILENFKIFSRPGKLFSHIRKFVEFGHSHS